MPDDNPFSARSAEQLRQTAQRHRTEAKQQSAMEAAISLRLAEQYEALADLKDGAGVSAIVASSGVLIDR